MSKKKTKKLKARFWGQCKTFYPSPTRHEPDLNTFPRTLRYGGNADNTDYQDFLKVFFKWVRKVLNNFPEKSVEEGLFQVGTEFLTNILNYAC